MELKTPKGGAKERSQRGYRCEEGSYRGESRKTLARESFIVVVVMFVVAEAVVVGAVAVVVVVVADVAAVVVVVVVVVVKASDPTSFEIRTKISVK